MYAAGHGYQYGKYLHVPEYSYAPVQIARIDRLSLGAMILYQIPSFRCRGAVPSPPLRFPIKTHSFNRSMHFYGREHARSHFPLLLQPNYNHRRVKQNKKGENRIICSGCRGSLSNIHLFCLNKIVISTLKQKSKTVKNHQTRINIGFDDIFD